MRAELAAAAASVVEHLATPRARSEEESSRLIALATLVVRARSSVERDGCSREIELVPGSEAPTRLVIVPARLLDGLDAIGCDRELALATVTKAALDSVPALRLAVLAALDVEDDLDTNVIAEAVRHPAGTTRRALEDLTAHQLVELQRQGDGKAHRWRLSAFARARMETFPEMSSLARSGRNKGKADIPISGKPARRGRDEPMSSRPRRASSSAREARELLRRIAQRHGELELDFVVERRQAQDASRRDAAVREVPASGGPPPA
jgi:hypothetical protein